MTKLDAMEKVELIKLIHKKMGVGLEGVTLEEVFDMFFEIEKIILQIKDHEI